MTSLDRLYAAAPVDATATLATDSVEHLSETTALDVGRAGRGTAGETHTEALDAPDAAGLTVGYGDPVALLARFVDRGWSVLTMATPTGRIR